MSKVYRLYLFVGIQVLFLQGISGQAQDSLLYYDQLNDFHSLGRLLANENLADARSQYYLGRSWNTLSPAKALVKIDSLLDRLKKVESDDPWIQRLRSLRVTYLRKNSQYEETISEGLEQLRLVSDLQSRFDISHNVAISYRRLDRYDSALSWSLPLLQQAEDMGDRVRRHRALQNLANLYSSLKEPTKSLEIEKELVLLADQLGNNDLRVLDRSNLAASLIDLDRLDSAKLVLSEAVSIAEETSENRRLPFVLYNLASLQYSENSYQDAILNLQISLQMAKDNQQHIIEVRGAYLLALCYQQLDKPREVAEIIDRGMDNARNYGLRQDQIYFLKLLAEIQESEGQLKKSIETLHALRALEDSVMNEARQKTISEMQAKYQSEKKEQEIDILRQEKLIADLKIDRQNFILIGTIVLLLSASAIGYTYYRSRTLSLAQQRLQVEQQLLRSQMSPHFLFNALSSIHSFIYQGNKHQAAEYLSLFSDLTRDVLDYSSLEWISLEKELDTLGKYFQVQQMRYPDISYQVSNKVGDTSNIKFPPMLLQPFVENAYEHGFRGRDRGNIELKIDQVDNHLCLQVVDDGEGLQDTADKTHDSKAIRIATDRIKMLYKGRKTELGVAVYNRQDRSGVIAELTIPLVEWI